MTYCAPCPDCGNKDVLIKDVEGRVHITCPKCGKDFTLDVFFPCPPEIILIAWDKAVCRYKDIRVAFMSYATIEQYCTAYRFLDDLYPGDDEYFWSHIFDTGNTISFEVSVPEEVAKAIDGYCRNKDWIRYTDWGENE